jgi:predicted small integral membrane protein
MIRWLKIALAASVSLFCVFYAVQNIVNHSQAMWFVQTMVSMQGHEAYPDSIIPAIRSPIIVGIMLWIIILLELTAGYLAGKGTVDMFVARNADSETFNASKTNALAGALIGVLIWFGIFGAFGGALFQMWQVEAGVNALRDAGMFSIQLGVVWMILKRSD